MVIQTFNNMKGLIYGSNSKRIECSKGGVLRIGGAEISVSPDGETIVPVLCNGSNGEYKATFTDDLGRVYELEKVTIRGGRIVPPPQAVTDLAEFRCRLDVLEGLCESIQEEIRKLNNIFDTNALNFLI